MSYNAFKNRSINKETFNAWFQKNCGNYYTDTSDYALHLYDARKLALRKNYPDIKFKAEAIKIRNRHCAEIPYCMTVYNCKTHDTPHIQFINSKRNKNITVYHLEIIRALFPAATTADAKKTNIALVFLIKSMLRRGQITQLNTVFRMFAIGTMESIITMHLINCLGNSEAGKMHALMFHDRACCMNALQYFDYAKAVGLAARRSARWVDGKSLQQDQVCLLSYWELCTGRSGHVSDWEKEKRNRCESYLPLKRPDHIGEATMETNAEVIELMKPILREIFHTVIRTKPTESFPDFALRRQTWCAGGTAAGEYLIHDGTRVRLDKRALFETLDHKQMVAMLDSVPEIRAVASEKFEISRSRAIYGTTATSYTIITYLIAAAEHNMNYMVGLESGLVGLPEMVSINNRIRVVSQPGVYTTMIDFEDFNLQHPIQLQYCMFDTMREVLVDKQAHPDHIRAAKWAADACLNQYVRFPGEKEYRKVTQGMFSGVRSTDFMNTTLNLTYARFCFDEVYRLFGEQPSDLYHLHKGDDVWISNTNLLFAVALYATMQSTNLRLQDMKQLFSQGVAEFLRVRYSPQGLMGYLCRAIGAFIERPLQGTDDTLPANILRSLNSQIMIMHRRGLNLETCQQMWEVVTDQWHALHTQSGKNVTIPKYVIEQTDKMNGLDLGPPMTYCRSGTSIAKMPVMRGVVASALSSLPQNMTKDYIKYLSQTIKDNFNADQVIEDIHKINAIGLVSQSDKYKALQHYINEVVVWKKQLPSGVQYERSEQEYTAYINAESMDKETYDIIKRYFNYNVHDVISDRRTIMGDIYKAIHSSPLRSITLAEHAFGVGTIESARICMSLNVIEEVAASGNRALDILMSTIDRAVIIELLKGIRGCSIAMESQLHPNVLSWAHKQAIELAINTCINNHIRTKTGWNRTLEIKLQSVISAIINEGTMLKMSRY